MSKAVVRLIFTNCYQDGENHYSQVWSTEDIPIPDDIAQSKSFKENVERATLAGATFIVTPKEETP